MKLFITLLILGCSLNLSFSQISSRVLVEGKISVPIGDNAEGLVVYNKTTSKGTITNPKGEFSISAGIGDQIEVVGMQYQQFIVLVDKGVVQSKRLHVFLNESVTQLEEVVVSPYDLLGNVQIDISRIQMTPDYEKTTNFVDLGLVYDIDYDFRPDELTVVVNELVEDDLIEYGINVVNIFKLAFTNKSKKENNDYPLDIDVKIREFYDTDFFENNLALPADQINDFVVFAEDNGLDFSFFEKGKELDLIEFLTYQRKRFKNP